MKLFSTRNLLIAGLTTVALGVGGLAVMPALAQHGPRPGMMERGPGHGPGPQAEMTCPNCGHHFLPPAPRGPRGPQADGFRQGPGPRGDAFGQGPGRPGHDMRGPQGPPHMQHGFAPPREDGPRGMDRRGMNDRRGPQGDRFASPPPRPERFGDRPDRGPGGDMAPPRPQQGERGQMLRQIFEGVNLDDDQREQVMEIAAAFRGEMQAWREANESQLRDLMAEARDARELEDRERLQSLMAEFRELRESAPKFTDSADQIRDILSEDQRAAFDANIDRVRDQMERRMNDARERGLNRKSGQRNRGDRGSRLFTPDPQENPSASAEKNRQGDQLDL